MKNKELFRFLSIFLAAMALVLWFLLPAFNFKFIVNFEFSFIDATFGKSMEGSQLLKFSILNFTGLIFIIGSIILPLLPLLVDKLKKHENIMTYLASGLSVIAAILVFLVKNLISTSDSSGSQYIELASGPIIIGIILLLNAAIMILPKFLDENTK